MGRKILAYTVGHKRRVHEMYTVSNFGLVHEIDFLIALSRIVCLLAAPAWHHNRLAMGS